MASIPSTNHSSKQALDVREALTYGGEALRAVALPLGGIGTGSVALAGDGGLRQWQIVNNVNHDVYVPDSFFAIWADTRLDAGRNTVVLQSDAIYDDSRFRPASSVSDHLIPQGSRRLLAELPGVDSLEIIAQYPIVEADYESRAIPVQVHLEAFSPFIPLNSKDSGLPAVLFNFTVTNPNDQAVHVSLMATQQNPVGWDGKTYIDGVRNPGYGGDVNSLVHLKDVTALDMGNVSLPADHPAQGRLALAVLNQPGADITAMIQWESPRQLWDHFVHRFGRLPTPETYPASSGVSPDGQTWNGALAVHFELAPGASCTVPFVLAWYFPNRYVTWDQRHMGVRNRESRFRLGNQYNNWFGSALAVVEYVRDNYSRLIEQTRLYRDCFFDSTLPWQLLESVAGPVSTIRTPTCLWNEDGRFHGFEGCHGASTTHGALEGCCPMNCAHVWNYEMALAKLFPDLEQSMRCTDLIDQMSPWGAIPHRTPLPLYLPRPWNEFIGGPRNPAGGFKSYWEMPFREHARITLENMSPDEVKGFYYQIDYTLTDVPADRVYFHAQWRCSSPLPYMDVHTLLEGVQGQGHYVGTYIAWGVHSNGWWGEGEIKFYLDGDTDWPTICGTGTEDYIGGAWGFEQPEGQYGVYSTPFLGLPQVIKPDGFCQSQQRFGMYRWHVMDPVRFQQDLRVAIQALGWRSALEGKPRYLPLQDDIASVALWYQTEPHAPFPELPDLNYLEVI